MRISILGCGWLGLPLAQHLISEGFDVKGSTTSKDKLPLLSQAGIDAYHLILPHGIDDESSAEFWNSDLLFLNIPPNRKNSQVIETYPDLIEQVLKRVELSSISAVHFASSTSVYSVSGGITLEEDAIKGSASRKTGEALLLAEDMVQNHSTDFVIYRFGGLYGYDRHPVHYLSGKTKLSDPLKPVNLIHQTDCVNVIHQAIKQQKKNKIYNVVSDGHPPRKPFYQSAAKRFDLKPPEFTDESTADSYRIVSNEKLKNDLGYSFTYPNPLDHTP